MCRSIIDLLIFKKFVSMDKLFFKKSVLYQYTVINFKHSKFSPTIDTPQIKPIKYFPLQLEGLDRSIHIKKIETDMSIILIVNNED